MEFTIQSDIIKALLAVAPKKDIRYYLNGVCFDFSGDTPVAVATNGHILLAVPFSLPNDAPNNWYGQYIVPREFLDGLKPSFKGAPYRLAITDYLVVASDSNSSISAKLIDGKYPDWRRVVPTTTSNHVSQFDPEYIGTFSKVDKFLGGKGTPTILHNGSGKPDAAGDNAARVVLTQGAVGVLMPMRHTTQPLDNPSWLAIHNTNVAVAA